MRPAIPDRALIFRILKFSVVGLCITGFYMIIFYFFLKLTQAFNAAIISYIIATVVNYFMQSVFTFQKKPRDFAMFVRFFAMHMICMMFNATMVWLLVSRLGLEPMISQGSVVFLTAALSFVLASRWVFPQRAGIARAPSIGR